MLGPGLAASGEKKSGQKSANAIGDGHVCKTTEAGVGSVGEKWRSILTLWIPDEIEKTFLTFKTVHPGRSPRVNTV